MLLSLVSLYKDLGLSILTYFNIMKKYLNLEKQECGCIALPHHGLPCPALVEDPLQPLENLAVRSGPS
jgi:hypothetical protein